MRFLGMVLTMNLAKKNQKDFEESLVEAQKEISDESNDFYKSFDDLLEAVGIPKKNKKRTTTN